MLSKDADARKRRQEALLVAIEKQAGAVQWSTYLDGFAICDCMVEQASLIRAEGLLLETKEMESKVVGRLVKYARNSGRSGQWS